MSIHVWVHMYKSSYTTSCCHTHIPFSPSGFQIKNPQECHTPSIERYMQTKPYTHENTCAITLYETLISSCAKHIPQMKHGTESRIFPPSFNVFHLPPGTSPLPSLVRASVWYTCIQVSAPFSGLGNTLCQTWMPWDSGEIRFYLNMKHKRRFMFIGYRNPKPT